MSETHNQSLEEVDHYDDEDTVCELSHFYEVFPFNPRLRDAPKEQQPPFVFNLLKNSCSTSYNWQDFVQLAPHASRMICLGENSLFHDYLQDAHKTKPPSLFGSAAHAKSPLSLATASPTSCWVVAHASLSGSWLLSCKTTNYLERLFGSMIVHKICLSPQLHCRFQSTTAVSS